MAHILLPTTTTAAHETCMARAKYQIAHHFFKLALCISVTALSQAVLDEDHQHCVGPLKPVPGAARWIVDIHCLMHQVVATLSLHQIPEHRHSFLWTICCQALCDPAQVPHLPCRGVWRRPALKLTSPVAATTSMRRHSPGPLRKTSTAAL